MYDIRTIHVEVLVIMFFVPTLGRSGPLCSIIEHRSIRTKTFRKFNMDHIGLGNHLRAARERSGLSQQVVADKLGLQRTAITRCHRRRL